MLICLVWAGENTIAAPRRVDALRQARQTLSTGLTSTRLAERVNAENITNMHATGPTPGSNPYRNKILYVKTRRDPKTGALLIENIILPDKAPFKEEYNPGHPAADPITGIVKLPNVELPVVIANSNETRLQASVEATMLQHLNRMDEEVISIMKA